MYSVETNWRVEQFLCILRIIAIAELINVKEVDETVKQHIVRKMLVAIDYSKKIGGNVLDVIPNMPIQKNKLTVCISIAFNSLDGLEAFKNALPQILKQGR